MLLFDYTTPQTHVRMMQSGTVQHGLYDSIVSGVTPILVVNTGFSRHTCRHTHDGRRFERAQGTEGGREEGACLRLCGCVHCNVCLNDIRTASAKVVASGQARSPTSLR